MLLALAIDMISFRRAILLHPYSSALKSRQVFSDSYSIKSSKSILTP